MESAKNNLNNVIVAVDQLKRAPRSNVTIRMDRSSLSNINNRIKPYKNIPKLFKPGLEEVADYFREEMIPNVFDKEGPGWHHLARRTVADRMRMGYKGQHPILMRTGDLLEELTNKRHHKHVEVIKVGKNCRIEIGGSSKKFIENQLGVRSQNLPARPMIPGTGRTPITVKDRIEIARILKAAVTGAGY